MVGKRGVFRDAIGRRRWDRKKNKKHKHTKLQEEESIVRIFPLVTEPEIGYQTCVRDAHDHVLDSAA